LKDAPSSTHLASSPFPFSLCGPSDCFIASKKVGESGHIIGLDMTEEMIAEARRNAQTGGCS